MGRTRIVRLLAALLALALVAAACSDDGGDDTADGDSGSSTTAPTTTATLPENAVEITGLSLVEVAFGDDGSVTMVNNGTDAVDLNGLWMCNRPTYLPLTGSLPAGEEISIPAADLGGLSIDGGDIGLYTSDTFDDPEAMLDYVAWGSGGEREVTAVEAGLWIEGETVEPDPAFGLIEKFDEAGGPEGWE